MGVDTAELLINKLKKVNEKHEVDFDMALALLKKETIKLLDVPAKVTTQEDVPQKPHVILVIGVNGVGKTTTIAKMAHLFQEEGKKVMLCAGDTFRAAAVDQIMIWGERLNVPVISHGMHKDPGSVAFDAVEKRCSKISTSYWWILLGVCTTK